MPNKNIAKMLMSVEEYTQTEWPDIYIYNLESGDSKLRYFGSAHNNNPQDKMFSEIREEFNEFLPDAVFVEGLSQLRTAEKEKVLKRLKKIDEQEAILKFGESGFTAKLAIEKGIFIDSPEPTLLEEATSLEKQGFSKDEIFAYYLLRYIQQRTRIPEPRPGLEEYVDSESRSLQHETGWNDFDFSLGHFMEVAKKIWGEGFDVNSSDLIDLVDPIPWEDKKLKRTIVNEVSRVSGQFRDEYIVQQIEEALQDYKRLFVVYGQSHAVIQEPALRKLLE